MPRGGKRQPKDGKRIGRPKLSPEADLTVGKGFASRILDRIKELKLDFLSDEGKVIGKIETPEDYALNILAANDAKAHAFFGSLLDRKYGKAVQPTMQRDTRENVPELDLGRFAEPSGRFDRAAHQPN